MQKEESLQRDIASLQRPQTEMEVRPAQGGVWLLHIASNVVWVLRADRWARRVQMYPTEAGYCWLPKLSSFTSVIAWDCREKLVWDGIVAGFIIYVSLIVRCHRSARAGISLTTVFTRLRWV